MTDELKPVRCGCGGEANIHKDDSTFGQMPIYTVSCNTCGMRSGRRSTEVQAVTAWNRAMGEDKVDELIEHIWREKLDTREAIANLVKRMMR